jgi:photosystem II stability/assembly factor-like uncharacterized protein
MARKKNLKAENGDVLVLVGTTKGAFLFRSDGERKRWDWSGPHFPGQAVYAIAYDGRAGRSRILAAAQSMHWGAVVHTTDNFGKKWTNPKEANVRFPSDSENSLKNIWQITRGPANEPDTLFCGVEPAALFESKDAGGSWQLVRGLFDHPHRPRWEPGGGGLCLHTIVPDASNPQRLLIAISTGGVYTSEDRGQTWSPHNRGVQAEFLPDKHPEFGQCVHKVAQAAGQPQRFYLQNHWGIYRSDDGAQSWQAIEDGVPSTFGFALATHPRNADTAFVIPIESDMFRCTPERKMRVYRTQDAGRSWEPLTKGLPQRETYETILRDGLATDDQPQTGLYFGTRSGKVYYSRDEGESWSLLHKSLPPVTCVKTARVGA